MSHTIPNFHDDVKIGGHQIFMMTYRLGDKELHFNFSLSLPLSLSPMSFRPVFGSFFLGVSRAFTFNDIGL